MASPTTTSARASELEPSQMTLNEPSMEDILASIRRIIAEDQSNSLGRNALGGLTRRSFSAAPAADDAPASNLDMAVAELHAPSEVHDHATDTASLHQSYAEPVVATPAASEHPESMYSQTDDQVEDTFVPAPTPSERTVAVDAETSLAMTDGAAVEDEGEPLMSPFVGASISSSFQTLAESVMLQDPDLIERVMRESMRPLLKAWLDDHLPSIVERLVRNEIERVARGGRGRNG